MATAEHYAERANAQTVGACVAKSDRLHAKHCENVSARVLPVDCDRYELVPALALNTPIDSWRWPLQMRIHSARVYTNRSLVQVR